MRRRRSKTSHVGQLILDGQPSTAIVLMCGLPASGKTTTATRLHTQLGGVLIRSCDVYKDLGIVLSDWVTRTVRFTVNVEAYHRARDRAYAEMAHRTEMSLARGASLVFVDAVHSERSKRQRLYETCARHRALPILVNCVCADFAEIRQRFQMREGHEGDPEREASDLSVFYDIERRWESPFEDTLVGGTPPPIVIYDTLNGTITRRSDAGGPIVASIHAVLAENSPTSIPH